MIIRISLELLFAQSAFLVRWYKCRTKVGELQGGRGDLPLNPIPVDFSKLAITVFVKRVLCKRAVFIDIVAQFGFNSGKSIRSREMRVSLLFAAIAQ